LPGTFIGGPRDKMRRYMGALALVWQRTSFLPISYN
jgi:hypothetical protein